jgi:hypothetical protein
LLATTWTKIALVIFRHVEQFQSLIISRNVIGSFLPSGGAMRLNHTKPARNLASTNYKLGAMQILIWWLFRLAPQLLDGFGSPKPSVVV